MKEVKKAFINKGYALMSFVMVSLFGFLALAQDMEYTVEGATDWKGAAMAIALGLAAVGGALGQGKAISAALEGIARNPSAQDKIFTPMILGLAFIESLVIFTLVYKFF